MGDGRDIEKPAVQKESESNSTWADIASDVAFGILGGAAGVIAAKAAGKAAHAAKECSTVDTARDVAIGAGEGALIGGALGTLAGMPAIGLIEGAVIGGSAVAAKKAVEACTGEEINVVDTVTDFTKGVFESLFPLDPRFLIGPVMLHPEARKKVEEAGAFSFDKIRSVTQDLYDYTRANPLTVATNFLVSPILGPGLTIFQSQMAKKK